MNVLKGLAALFTLCVVTPIWYYLMYQLLMRVNASEVMWLLYWIYLPVGFITAGMNKIIELGDKK